jgi:hypothetical protein
LPDSVNVKVVEEDAQTLYLVLRQNQSHGKDHEISNADLESGAGGTGSSDTICFSCDKLDCQF